ncbi:MAG: fluoride efflux transporter CrcB [Firmicutes bacterium]|nr:fluoride efflux transporter CrcB [Bacillota bacterium]
MEYILVGIGGAFGSIARFSLERIITQKTNSSLPIGTFIINITGALLLGLVSGLGINGNLYLLTAEGFLGAYTTFSTFMFEGFNLFQENEKLNAFIYILGSLTLGIIGFAAGLETGNLLKVI